ncbi:MAG TPA: polysaccharide deacetylase family protein [Acidiferrobacterales bacterium]
MAVGLSPLLRLAGGLVSPGGRRGRLSILIYHRVLPEPDPMRPHEIDAATFHWQMAALRGHFTVLPLTEAVERLAAGGLPPRAAAITFDDGYADNVDIALPILQGLGLSATFFIATGFLNGGRMWNDSIIEALRIAPGARADLTALGLGEHDIGDMAKRHATAAALIGKLKYLPVLARGAAVERLTATLGVRLPDDLMMTDAGVNRLHRAGMGIGGHTVNHPILAGTDPADVRREIAVGREYLEGLLGERVALFAYPNGRPHQDYRAEHVKLVKALGFRAAVSTAWGAARPGADCFQLPRFTPWDRSPARFIARLLLNVRHAPNAAV